MMTMTVFSICLIASALLYMASGCVILSSMKGNGAKASTLLRWPIFIAMIFHAYALYGQTFRPEAVYFGVAQAFSAMSLIAVGVLIVESFIHRLNAQLGIIVVAAAFGAIAPMLLAGERVPPAETTPLFIWHLATALGGYAVMGIATVQAVLMSMQNRRLKMPSAPDARTPLLDSLPGLVVMERIFIRIVAVGFVLITLTLMLGMLTTYERFGDFLRFDHKVALTWLSWLIFGILLTGRYYFGWRSRQALTWFWAGIIAWVTAYIGYHFILELLV